MQDENASLETVTCSCGRKYRVRSTAPAGERLCVYCGATYFVGPPPDPRVGTGEMKKGGPRPPPQAPRVETGLRDPPTRSAFTAETEAMDEIYRVYMEPDRLVLVQVWKRPLGKQLADVALSAALGAGAVLHNARERERLLENVEETTRSLDELTVPELLAQPASFEASVSDFTTAELTSRRLVAGLQDGRKIALKFITPRDAWRAYRQLPSLLGGTLQVSVHEQDGSLVTPLDRQPVLEQSAWVGIQHPLVHLGFAGFFIALGIWGTASVRSFSHSLGLDVVGAPVVAKLLLGLGAMGLLISLIRLASRSAADQRTRHARQRQRRRDRPSPSS